MTTRLHLAVATLALTAACASAPVIRKFPARPPMWKDPDTTPFAPRPAKYEAPQVWDTVDNTVFSRVVEALALERPGRAKNVNAVDEVPDSSWFTNRIDEIATDVDAITQGACVGADPAPGGPWTVIAGKPDGANPGFLVEHADGRKFFFKPDGGRGGERQSAADVIGARVYYAAGFNTACTRIAYVPPAAFVLSPDATTKDFAGDKVPYTRPMLDRVLDYGVRDTHGAIRGELSELLDGKPIGPWRDFGVRPDDPNDVIAHEDRRELRGSYVFGAWLGHYDAREQNSLDTWVATDGDAGYVRHYMFDFGDCLGSMSAWGRVSRRRGHAYELDWSVAVIELITLGALDRPWRDPELGPGGPTLGYYTTRDFEPDRYRTAYPFGPYTRVTEADAAWGARILARISPAAIHALVRLAKLSDPVVATALEQTLLGRREALLVRYLGVLSPLARPHIDADQRVCVADARFDAGLVRHPDAVKVRAITGVAADTALTIAPGAIAGEQCVVGLPTGAERPSYAVVELTADATRSLFVHVYTDDAGYHVAGIDR